MEFTWRRFGAFMLLGILMDFMSSNFGRGISRSYIDDWGFEHALAPIPSPRRSGFLMGFAAFHMVPFMALVVMSFFR